MRLSSGSVDAGSWGSPIDAGRPFDEASAGAILGTWIWRLVAARTLSCWPEYLRDARARRAVGWHHEPRGH